MRSILSEGRMENTLPLAPMAAGLFGYFGYEMIRHAEKIPTNNPDELSHYDSIFIRPSIVAIFDRVFLLIVDIIILPFFFKLFLIL